MMIMTAGVPLLRRQNLGKQRSWERKIPPTPGWRGANILNKHAILFYSSEPPTTKNIGGFLFNTKNGGFKYDRINIKS